MILVAILVIAIILLADSGNKPRYP